MSEEEGVQVVTFAGKGQGLAAARPFQVGDVIISEPPMITMPGTVFDYPDPDKIERWLDRKINALTSQHREEFYNLSDCRSSGEEKTTLGLFYTNCMSFIGESAAVFPLMARSNHSCSPNAEFVTNTAAGRQELIAVQPIKEGQEVTLSYLPANGEGSDVALKRRDYLKEFYGFHCVCPACTQNSDDQVREQIRILQVKGVEKLNIYELEELLDGLDMIGSKVHHREEMYRRLFDVAINNNDKVLAFKCFSSVNLYKAILSCPQMEEWKASFLKMATSVSIGGKQYLFPPDSEPCSPCCSAVKSSSV